VPTELVTLGGGPARSGAYRQLVPLPGTPHLLRGDLASDVPHVLPSEVVLTLAHLSDLHVCDAQSPARVEFLDRWADPDSPVLDRLGEVGVYRAQEMLTAQVVEACVRAVNATRRGPRGGGEIDLAIVTGDNTDNAQANELAWYLALLDGGRVHPDSGDLTRYEGVADGTVFDDRFWHPSTERDDLPRSRYGFPQVPGLLDAARAPFDATGLAVPWLAVHGNHDRLLQGTYPAVAGLAAAATGTAKPIALPPEADPETVLALLAALEACKPEALAALARAQTRRICADPQRRIISRTEFVRAHVGSAARPAGHGFADDNRASGRAYYRHDHDQVTLLVLDTVNEHGGWQGSLDLTQLGWLERQLLTADRERRYVVLASHHPLETLVNPANDGTERRALGQELAELLAGHRCVVLWLAGHTHAVAVSPGASYWQVVAPSLIDWPQQARIVEIMRGHGLLRIAVTMLDHEGSAPWEGTVGSVPELAGLSRELAANDWQWRQTRLEDHPRAGRLADRNVELLLSDPWP
jgi:metallophosphoesterase (TIGR03767 family)